MAVKYGYFNSIDGDRKYNAEDMTMYFKGLVSDGIYQTIGDMFVVNPGNGLSVNIGTGRALVNMHWIENTSVLTMNLGVSPVNVDTYKLILLRCDLSDSERNVSIVIVDSASDAINLTKNENVTELCLARVRIRKNSSTISQSDIRDYRGSTYCPWITGLIKQVDTSQLNKQFYAYYNEQTAELEDYMFEQKTNFENWLNNLQSELMVNTALKTYKTSCTTTVKTSRIQLIPDFEEGDVLLIHINGILLDAGTEYTIDEQNRQIILTSPVDSGNTVVQILLKSVIAKPGQVSSGGSKLRVYVDPVNGSDENGGLSPAEPMKTLQGAIAKYSAVLYVEIFAGAGNYSGDITINNQCVNITNIDSIVDDSTTVATVKNSYVSVDGGTLVFNNFEISGTASTHVAVQNSGDLICETCTFTRSGATGSDVPIVKITGDSRAFLNDCTFKNSAESAETLLLAENGSVICTHACSYADSGVISAKNASKIVDDSVTATPAESNAENGSVIIRNGEQIAPYVPPVNSRLTVYLNADTGSDTNDGLTANNPMKTVTAVFTKYADYGNIRLQFAAGAYDLGINSESKKIALAGADAATTILNGRINVTSCTLTLSNLTVSITGNSRSAAISASTGSRVYGYHANISSSAATAQYTDSCLIVNTSSQCYLDGSTITTTTSDGTDADVIAVRSGGGSVVGLGYCKINGTICASTTGEIKTTGTTTGKTKIESGGLIYVNGAMISG